MKKIVAQATVTIALFFSLWYALIQLDWVSIFEIEKVSNETEQKLGDLFWEVLKKNENESDDTYVNSSIDSLVTHVCKANNIDREKIKVHVLTKDEINAFAFPDGHLVVYTGLILNSDNQEELTGVICHEIAHIQLDHVMKKLVKEIGLSVLISITSGNSNVEVIKETVKMLSSSAFDRTLEKEADIKAVDYLTNAQVDPKPFANFLYKISDSTSEIPKYLKWISTHPDSKERAEYILEYSAEKKAEYTSILSSDTWDKLKHRLED